MNLIRSSIRIFIANAFSSLFVFLGITFFARELGPSQMGVFFLFQALLGIVSIPANFGIGGAVTKRISEGEGQAGTILSTAVLLKSAFILPFILGILTFQEIINEYLGAELAVYLALTLVIQESAKLAIQILKGELRVGETAGPKLARNVVYILLGGVFVGSGYGVQGIVYGFIGGFGIMLVWAVWKSSTSPAAPSIGAARSLVDYSKYAFISSIGGYFYSWMDIAILGLILTQSDVGVYEIAWRVTAVVMLFSNSIATTIFPQVSQWSAEDASEKISSVLSYAIPASLFVSIPAFFGVLLFSQEILGIVFGMEYATGWVVLIILMGEKVIQSIHIIFGRSLQAINKPDLAAKATVVAISLNLILNILLISWFGIIGAAVATAVSFLANSILHAHYLSEFITIEIPYRYIAISLLASVGMVIVLEALEKFIEVENVLSLSTVMLCGVITYSLFLLSAPSTRDIVLKTVDNQ